MNPVEKLQYYQERNYLFHGSSQPGLEIIEPKLAQDINSGREFNKDTAVFATPLAAVAAAFACIDPNKLPAEVRSTYKTRYGVYVQDGLVEVRLARCLEPYLNIFSGYVYVLDAKSTPKAPWQVKFHERVNVLDVVSVTIRDFKELGGITA